MYAQDCDEQFSWAATRISGAGALNFRFPNGCQILTAGCGGYQEAAGAGNPCKGDPCLCCNLWGHQILPYMKAWQSLTCPSSDYTYPGNYHPFGGYSANGLLFQACGLPFPMSKFEAPGDTLLLMDSGTTPAGSQPFQGSHYYLAWWEALFGNNSTTVSIRHNETITVGYVDGHAKVLKRDVVTAPAGRYPWSCTGGHPLWRPINK